MAKAKNLLDGDETALASAKETLAGLFARKRQLLLDAGFPEDYLEPHYTCPDCRDTGYIGTEKCHCFKKAIIDLLYQQSNLQGILEEENFSTFRLEYYSSNHIDPLTGRSSLEAVKTALKTCRSFVDNFSSEFHNLLLYGDTGVGKTFLSHCIAKELIDASYSVIYFSAVQLFEHFAENTFGGKREEHSDGLAPIYECDLLIIDDLGTELTNAFTASQLSPVSTSGSCAGRQPSFPPTWRLTISNPYTRSGSSPGSAAPTPCCGSPGTISGSRKNY